MAQTILIKRSTSTATPGSLTAGELAYSDSSDKLFIGAPADNAVTVIGGKVFMDMLDHTAGTLTTSSALIADGSGKLDIFKTGNITLTGSSNTLATTSGTLTITSAGSLDVNHSGTIDLSTQANELAIKDNEAASFEIKEGSISYLKLVTTNSAEKIFLGKNTTIDGNGSSGGVTVSDGLIDMRTGTGSVSKIKFYCESGNAHFQTLQASPHSASASNVLVLPSTGTTLATQDGTETLTNKSLTAPTLTGTTTAAAANFSGTTTFAGGANNGVSITQGAIKIKNGGTQSYVDFYCEASNAHYVRVQAPAHSAFSGNVTITLPTTTSVLVGRTSTDTLTNKTLTSPDINTPDIDGGTVDGTAINNSTIGATTPNSGAFTTVTVDNLNINGNTISSTSGDIAISPNGSGVINASTSRITGVVDPTGAQDAATKAYVDAVKVGLDFKDSVRVASTANLTISGPGAAIDGITLSSGNRVLVKNQSTGSQNGIYVFNGAGSAMTRATDADSNAEVTSGLFVFVEEGTLNSDNGFVLTTDGSITVGSTALVFTQFSGAGQIVAGAAITKSGNTLDVAVDGRTLEVNSDALRIKGITATAVGDLLVGQASNAGYTRLVKPSGNATASDYILSMNTSGVASWANTLDGGSF
tara:strand:- start:280 stop:2208 length:1929 start_codon:yes stop_codon:yes gene_type:complete